ncbi:SDR family oxidoreductase [Stigmatella sp. ncwal1]|uniref:SDR family oxidoreductase n=1 Tax=Stigmatella ashevillensis TaxID=2995309 RepID=A0ABT5DMN6_9BACT|nr:SDR family oxidoreductase [Stigmatella ashevillena]MDC0714863.1 SDR family oxidoreductase [Stigmatella ashevillena]
MIKVLSSKVALVIGGSRGIGAAAALRLAEDGAHIAISYAASAEKAQAIVRQLEAKGVRAVAFQADQADPSAVEKLVKSVVSHFGHLDILVNNAAIFVMGDVDNPHHPLTAIERQSAVNFNGIAAAIRAASKVMGKGGRIISVGSGVTYRGGFPGLADSLAAKSALVGFSKGAARDLAPKGITVNVVQSGYVNTDMNPETSAYAPAFKASTALGRYGRPEEIAAGIAFLARPDASYVTGSILDVDGGYGV